MFYDITEIPGKVVSVMNDEKKNNSSLRRSTRRRLFFEFDFELTRSTKYEVQHVRNIVVV